MKVFLNPGHDLVLDPGAVNNRKGLTEAELVAKIGAVCKEALERAGIEVKLLQQDNLAGESGGWPTSVCGRSNFWGADIFVSIHINSAGAETASGAETWAYQAGTRSDALAKCIQRQLIGTFDDLEDRGVRYSAGLCVLKNTSCPACLVECGFLSNDDEAELIANNTEAFGKAIARGITDYQLL